MLSASPCSQGAERRGEQLANRLLGSCLHAIYAFVWYHRFINTIVSFILSSHVAAVKRDLCRTPRSSKTDGNAEKSLRMPAAYGGTELIKTSHSIFRLRACQTRSGRLSACGRGCFHRARCAPRPPAHTGTAPLPSGCSRRPACGGSSRPPAHSAPERPEARRRFSRSARP